MSIGIDEGDGYSYGYPKISLLRKGWVRISQGWFLPGLSENEPSCYLDFYINQDGKGMILLDYFYHCYGVSLTGREVHGV